MPKRIKITLYVILILIVVAVVWLMLGSYKPTIEITDDTQISTEENNEQNTTNTNFETDTFEEDVMKDLEGFFGNNNGYEDVEGEYGFTNPEN